MNKQMDSRLRSLNWNSPLRALLLVALVLPLVAVVPGPPGVQAMHAQPLLQELAARNANATVSVIVQKTTRSTGPEALAKQLGGRITKDLSIINAFVADMPAQAALELSRAAGVRWVSLNSPVNKSNDAPVLTSWATTTERVSVNSISTTFNSVPILPNSYVWFSSVVRVTGLPATPVTLNFDNASVQVGIWGQTYGMSVSSSTVIFDPNTTTATTTYDPVEGKWVTRVPSRLGGTDVFLTGVGTKITSYLPGSVPTVTFSGRFSSDTAGVTVSSWQWSAAVYANWSPDNNAIGVKPCDDATASQYSNSDNAGTPENFKIFVIGGALGGGGTNYTGGYTAAQAALPAKTFINSDNLIDSAQGPNDTWAYGSNVTQYFGGFMAEQTPGYRVARVEAVLRAYAPNRLPSNPEPRVTAFVNGQSVSTATVGHSRFDNYTSPSNAGTLYVDVTGGRNWQWSDFRNLQLSIDQSGFDQRYPVYYDAIGLRITTHEGTDSTSSVASTTEPAKLVDASKLASVYNRSLGLPELWSGAATGRLLQGQGMTVAVVDSGVVKTKDLKDRLIGAVNFDKDDHISVDGQGHGTFVAGIIAGDGDLSDGAYMGVAPRSNILSVRASNDLGMSTEADIVAALQYVLNNKSVYNIKVVNLSLNSSAMQSYHTSPLCAAVEVLWFNGIVVVVSAGNTGTANLYPPANDPFVITVGAADDKDTVSISDDTVASFSAYGTTQTGAVKPEIVAPGKNIIGLLPDNEETKIGLEHVANRLNENYFRMSGTSMAAPMVSGAVALLLQDEPTLNPDQVKYRLMATAARSSTWPGYDAARAGAGYLDIRAAILGTTTQTQNSGIRASQLLWTGPQPVMWGSVNWNSVNWNSVNWNSVNWNSVNWNSVNWNSDYWNP